LTLEAYRPWFESTGMRGPNVTAGSSNGGCPDVSGASAAKGRSSTPDLERIPFAVLPPKALRALHRYGYGVLGEKLYLPQERLRKTALGTPKFVIRVDDYPRWDISSEEYLPFHEVFARNGVSYILGVTPFLDYDGLGAGVISRRAVEILRGLRDHDVEFALHGFTHRRRMGAGGFPCETCFYDDESLEWWRQRAFNWFEYHLGGAPRHYIPPFNTLTQRDFAMLSSYMPVIHGGPLSLSTLGKFSQTVLNDGVTYLPSFEPFYNRARGLLEVFDKGLNGFRHSITYSLTLHWAWEYEKGLGDVERLLSLLIERGWLASGDGSESSPSESVW
jgi:hypothetical protein